MGNACNIWITCWTMPRLLYYIKELFFSFACGFYYNLSVGNGFCSFFSWVVYKSPSPKHVNLESSPKSTYAFCEMNIIMNNLSLRLVCRRKKGLGGDEKQEIGNHLCKK